MVVSTAGGQSGVRRPLHAHPNLQGRGVYACLMRALFLLFNHVDNLVGCPTTTMFGSIGWSAWSLSACVRSPFGKIVYGEHEVSNKQETRFAKSTRGRAKGGCCFSLSPPLPTPPLSSGPHLSRFTLLTLFFLSSSSLVSFILTRKDFFSNLFFSHTTPTFSRGFGATLLDGHYIPCRFSPAASASAWEATGPTEDKPPWSRVLRVSPPSGWRAGTATRSSSGLGGRR